MLGGVRCAPAREDTRQDSVVAMGRREPGAVEADRVGRSDRRRRGVSI